MTLITATISEQPVVTERTNEEFYESMEAFLLYGSNVTRGEMNLMASQMNTLSSEINNTANNIESQSVQISGYLSETKNVRDSAANYAAAAQASKDEVQQLLNNVDIAGTGGYTIEATDSLLEDRELENFLEFNL